jgi:tRNA pseudouridine55 synthase
VCFSTLGVSDSMHGFLIIDKPGGITSHDVVAAVRRRMGIRRVGHAGTLDPAATGVLVVALGAATRLIEYVQDETVKRYHAIIELGITTETDDAEGAICERKPVPALTDAALQMVLQQFVGQIMQVPPMYSALHHQGQRLHELARAGIQLDLPARPVQIDQITMLAWESPLLTIDIACRKGTYIRSLARDIGLALGCGATLAQLRRTAVGAFTLEHAVTLESLPQPVLAPEVAVTDWPPVVLSQELTTRVQHGLPIPLPGIEAGRVRAHTSDGILLALLLRREDQWYPHKVFNWT